ncbi:hypothetical protein GR254_05835, partial [Mycobacterium tuberculosis]|nr:hypothetical protein [Mycobacterium tuberculosis]
MLLRRVRLRERFAGGDASGVVIATRIAWVQATTVLGHTVDRVLKKPP